MNTNIEVLRELDELVEAARLLGVTQAKRGFGCHTDEDRRFERAMYESIDKHRAALLDREAKHPAPPSTPVRVSWADFWIAQGDWPTANDYAAFEKAEQWLLAQQPAAVDDPDAQSAEIDALRAEVERLTLEIGRLQQQYDERTACMIVHRGQALACSDAVHTAYSDERRRADKLAEALRLIESAKDRGFGIDYARGVAQSVLLRDQEEGHEQ
jgi:cell division protein FtsB